MTCLDYLLSGYLGLPLPSQMQLAEITGSSRHQVRIAIQDLADKGKIEDRHGRWYVVDQANVELSNYGSHLLHTTQQLSAYTGQGVTDLRGQGPTGAALKRRPVSNRSTSRHPRQDLEQFLGQYHQRYLPPTNKHIQEKITGYAFRTSMAVNHALISLYCDPGSAVLVAGPHPPGVVHRLMGHGARVEQMRYGLADPAFDLDRLTWHLRERVPRLVYIQGYDPMTGMYVSEDVLEAASKILHDYHDGWCIELSATPTGPDAAERQLITRMRGKIIYIHHFDAAGLDLMYAHLPEKVREVVAYEFAFHSSRLTDAEASVLLPEVRRLALNTSNDTDPIISQLEVSYKIACEELSGIPGDITLTHAWLDAPPGTDEILAQRGVLVDRGGLFSILPISKIFVSLSNTEPSELRQALRIVKDTVVSLWGGVE